MYQLKEIITSKSFCSGGLPMLLLTCHLLVYVMHLQTLLAAKVT